MNLPFIRKKIVKNPENISFFKKMFYKSMKNVIIDKIDGMAALFYSNSPVSGLNIKKRGQTI